MLDIYYLSFNCFYFLIILIFIDYANVILMLNNLSNFDKTYNLKALNDGKAQEIFY